MKTKTQKDFPQKYNKGTIAIHWITALLILTLFPLGKYMEGLEPSEKIGLIKIHAILGIVALVLTLFRTWLFFKAPRPADVKTGSVFNDKLAIWIHNIFYFLLFGLTISGMVTMFLGGYGEAIKLDNYKLIKVPTEIPSLKAHGIMAVIMMALFAMHVIGVVKHYILKKENTLKRMS